MGRRATVRLKADEDIWECPACHSWNLAGKKCQCGKSMVDRLTEKLTGTVEKAPETRRERKKTAPPVKVTVFLESYYKPLEEDK